MENNLYYNLLLEAQKGNKFAFKQLVEKTNNYAYMMAYKMIANEDDSRDIVQEAYIRVWKNMNKYNPSIKFTTWLYKIVINLCLDHLKMHKRRNYYVTNSAHVINLNRTFDLEKEIENDDLINIIKKLAKQLTPKQQVVFVLYFLEEKNLDEIYSLTGFKKGNIKSNVYYARIKMQELMHKEINFNKLMIQ